MKIHCDFCGSRNDAERDKCRYCGANLSEGSSDWADRHGAGVVAWSGNDYPLDGIGPSALTTSARTTTYIHKIAIYIHRATVQC